MYLSFFFFFIFIIVTSVYYLIFAVLKCPQLSTPDNGMIMSSLCPNYYGAQCQIGCLQGYKLSGGSGMVTCQSDNNNNAFWTPNNLQCQGLFYCYIKYETDTTSSCYYTPHYTSSWYIRITLFIPHLNFCHSYLGSQWMD